MVPEKITKKTFRSTLKRIVQREMGWLKKQKRQQLKIIIFDNTIYSNINC
jgi:late competence protein required for DNA uptake (superfamily II DNA/RNA helicase)